ncbi:MAG TPA: hypothetical protein DEA31_00010 [Alphaproteobacteria bacterium]|nr:hypothetical protein [Alphaproteobacteria bacterium]
MSENKSQCLMSWILWRPLKFALTLLGLGIAVMIPYEIVSATIGGATALATLLILSIAAIVFATYLLFHRLPHDNLDRYSFVALENAQAYVLALAVFVAMLAIMQAQSFLISLAMMGTAGNVIFVLLAAVMFVAYAYLVGLSLANVYAKFRRGRAMNIPTWKIICSIPFGFNLIWIPGYILPDEKAPKTPVIPIHAAWYKNLTNWIVSRPSHTILAFAILTLFTGFMFGIQTIFWTCAATLLFAMWASGVGAKRFCKNIGGAYATVAVVLNIIMIFAVSVITYRQISQISAYENMAITVTDTTQNTNQ